jgi:hypothetical protein
LIVIGLLLLFLFNAYAFSRPWLHRPSVVMEWRKGPLIYESSPYSTTNAARIFWPIFAIMVDVYAAGAFLATRWIRKRVPAHRRAITESIFVILLLVAVVGAGELMARWYIRNYMFLQYRPDPELYWYNRPNLRDHVDVTDGARKSTNSLGMRGREDVPLEKEPGEIRIFVVGDSSTFGLGVLDEETYSHVLQERLSEATGRRVRVINSGCPGHTSYQGLILLQRYGLAYKPDLIIWAYNNDPCLDMAREKDRVSQNPRVVAAQRVLYRSDLYLLAMRVVLDAIYGWNLKKFETKYPRNQDGWVRRIPFEDYKDYLQRFVDLARSVNSKILFLRMPLNLPMCEVEPIYYTSFDFEYRDYLLEFCKRNNLPVVNLEEMFLHPYDPGLFLTGHLFHPSPRGHRIIGERLASYILAKGLIPR